MPMARNLMVMFD